MSNHKLTPWSLSFMDLCRDCNRIVNEVIGGAGYMWHRPAKDQKLFIHS